MEGKTRLTYLHFFGKQSLVEDAEVLKKAKAHFNILAMLGNHPLLRKSKHK